MAKLFYSGLCPDTPQAIRWLEAHGRNDVERFDITGELSALKAFLRYRESREEFEAIRAVGAIGVPMLVEADESLRFDFELSPERSGR